MEINEMQEAFLQKQNELRKDIDLTDGFDPTALKLVAGMDLAYWKEGEDEWAVCCIVVVDYATHTIVEKRQSVGKIEVPYMPGFLAFREIPLVLKAAQMLEHVPDLYFFDGNGYLHPRHMGIATHASFYLKRPTIGIAKSYFRVDRETDYREPENEVGSFTDIVINGETYGRVLRTHKNVRPVFLSVGNYISLDMATKVTINVVGKESHIPIPTRLADLETHYARKQLIDRNRPITPEDV